MQAGMTPNNCHQPEEKIVVAFDVKRIQIGLIQIGLRLKSVWDKCLTKSGSDMSLCAKLCAFFGLLH